MARGNPLAPLCAYDIEVVGEGPQAVMAVHPRRHAPGGSVVPFGLYHGPFGRVLDGEIDVFGVPALAEALAALPEAPSISTPAAGHGRAEQQHDMSAAPSGAGPQYWPGDPDGCGACRRPRAGRRQAAVGGA